MSDLQIPLRYELKYFVPESRVEAVRDAIRPFCRLDPYSSLAADHQYVIDSIYLDTARHDLYRAARAGRSERFKVRARRYGTDATGPVFLEVKRKQGGLVRKTRAEVPQHDWAELLRGPAREASVAEQAFRYVVDRYALQPVQLMRYEREAWCSEIDEYARITFDRRMLCQPACGWAFDGEPSAWLPLDHRDTMNGVQQGVLLELKCTADVPLWMMRLAERLELHRTGFSKYCNGIERLWGDESLPAFLSRAAS